MEGVIVAHIFGSTFLWGLAVGILCRGWQALLAGIAIATVLHLAIGVALSGDSRVLSPEQFILLFAGTAIWALIVAGIRAALRRRQS